MSAPWATTWLHMAPGDVEPHPLLMLNPSGWTPTGLTSAPNSHKTSGATL